MHALRRPETLPGPPSWKGRVVLRMFRYVGTAEDDPMSSQTGPLGTYTAWVVGRRGDAYVARRLFWDPTPERNAPDPALLLAQVDLAAADFGARLARRAPPAGVRSGAQRPRARHHARRGVRVLLVRFDIPLVSGAANGMERPRRLVDGRGGGDRKRSRGRRTHAGAGTSLIVPIARRRPHPTRQGGGARFGHFSSRRAAS